MKAAWDVHEIVSCSWPSTLSAFQTFYSSDCLHSSEICLSACFQSLLAEHSTLAHLWAQLIAMLRALLLLSPEAQSHPATWLCCQKIISYAALRDTLSAAFSSNSACCKTAEWGSSDYVTLHAAESGTERWCQGQIVPRQNCSWQEVEMSRKTLSNLTSHYFIS